MKIKVYEGCVVKSGFGIYTGQVFAERFPKLIPDRYMRFTLLSGPNDADYDQVRSETFPIITDDSIYDYDDSGDILKWKLYDSDKIKGSELEKISKNPLPAGRMNIIENDNGYVHFLQAGENCLFVASLSNCGLIGAECFFEMDEDFSFDENLQEFINIVEEKILNE